MLGTICAKTSPAQSVTPKGNFSVSFLAEFLDLSQDEKKRESRLGNGTIWSAGVDSIVILTVYHNAYLDCKGTTPVLNLTIVHFNGIESTCKDKFTTKVVWKDKDRHLALIKIKTDTCLKNFVGKMGWSQGIKHQNHINVSPDKLSGASLEVRGMCKGAFMAFGNIEGSKLVEVYGMTFKSTPGTNCKVDSLVYVGHCKEFLNLQTGKPIGPESVLGLSGSAVLLNKYDQIIGLFNSIDTEKYRMILNSSSPGVVLSQSELEKLANAKNCSIIPLPNPPI